MAFTSELVERKEIFKGIVLEKWSWDGAAVTSGTISPDSTDAEGYGIIRNIFIAAPTDDVAAVRAEYNNNVLSTSVTLTFTANDTGTLTIIGVVA
jgi:hypothetical protein